jgi:hypothetical protein
MPSHRPRPVPLLAVLATILLGAGAGCSHVQLEPAGQSVRRLGAQEAPACERLGTTRVKVLSKVLFFDRSETKMAEELTTLARNAAGDMGGNAVIAEGGIQGGKQVFGVYRCPED